MVFIEDYFLNPIGLVALASLIPLIIIYLIKEKPKVQFFPSVRFLVKKKKHRFMPNVSRFIKDPLFILQLLVLILLSAALAQPYINVTENLSAENVLIILDTSASMQAVNGISRFDEARRLALESMGDTTSIILVGEFPEIFVQDADSRQAKRLLETVKPKDTTTNLYDAIILADDYVGSGDVVVVISDFIHTTNEKDVEAALSVIRSKGINVVLKNVFSESSNIGIVDMEVKSNTTSVRIKNYQNKSVSGKLVAGSSSVELVLGPMESETFNIAVPAGTSEITLDMDDGFSLDNKAYVSRPEKGDVKILYITNSRDLFLYTALRLVDGVSIDIAEPPVINDYNYDVFVLKNADREKIVPSIIQNLDSKVKSGSSLIVYGNDMETVKDIIGFSPEKKSTESRVPVESIASAITKDIDFGSTKTYFVADKEGVLAEVSGEPVITLVKHGSGNMLFYGLDDSGSAFQYELMYPVFWKRLVAHFVGREDVKTLNIKTGDIITTSGAVTDPDGSILNSRSLIAEETGFYVLSDKVVASNLIDEKESDINGFFFESSSTEAVTEKTQNWAPMDIAIYAVIVAALLVLLELFYIKFRGDI